MRRSPDNKEKILSAAREILRTGMQGDTYLNADDLERLLQPSSPERITEIEGRANGRMASVRAIVRHFQRTMEKIAAHYWVNQHTLYDMLSARSAYELLACAVKAEDSGLAEKIMNRTRLFDPAEGRAFVSSRLCCPELTMLMAVSVVKEMAQGYAALCERGHYCGPDRVGSLVTDRTRSLSPALYDALVEPLSLVSAKIEEYPVAQLIMAGVPFPQDLQDFHEWGIKKMQAEEDIARMARDLNARLLAPALDGEREQQEILDAVYDVMIPAFSIKKPHVRFIKGAAGFAQQIYTHNKVLYGEGLIVEHHINPNAYAPWSDINKRIFVRDVLHEIGHVVENTFLYPDLSDDESLYSSKKIVAYFGAARRALSERMGLYQEKESLSATFENEARIKRLSDLIEHSYFTAFEERHAQVFSRTMILALDNLALHKMRDAAPKESMAWRTFDLNG